MTFTSSFFVHLASELSAETIGETALASTNSRVDSSMLAQGMRLSKLVALKILLESSVEEGDHSIHMEWVVEISKEVLSKTNPLTIVIQVMDATSSTTSRAKVDSEVKPPIPSRIARIVALVALVIRTITARSTNFQAERIAS